MAIWDLRSSGLFCNVSLLPTTNVRCLTSQKSENLNCASNSALKMENLLARNSQQVQPRCWQIYTKTTEGGGRDTDFGVRELLCSWYMCNCVCVCVCVCVQHTMRTAITVPPNMKKMAQPYVVPRNETCQKQGTWSDLYFSQPIPCRVGYLWNTVVVCGPADRNVIEMQALWFSLWCWWRVKCSAMFLTCRFLNSCRPFGGV